MFLDPRITQSQYSLKLDMHVRTQTSSLGDTLNRFKQCFNTLSGKEVDQQTFNAIESFKQYLGEANKLCLKLKSAVEKKMTNKVDIDNQKVKLF